MNKIIKIYFTALIFYIGSGFSFLNSPINIKTKLTNTHINYNFNNKNDFYTEIKNCNVTLADVAGQDFAKSEVMDVIDFLKDSKKYTDMGARMPKGILLVGNPGLGKTILSKAIAGEAKVPFFATTGSSFVEVYVGVGSSRVRTLFNKAKECSPSIIFIDEIDAIGGSRTNSPSKNDEREGTLNQLLSELDGMTTNTNVIVIAATNRLDILDQALIRRFDKKLMFTSLDRKARFQVLNVHAKNKKLNKNVDLNDFAKIMIGFNGADIENVLNQAAIIACKKEKENIDNDCIQSSYHKLAFGAKLYDKEVSENINNIISVHEASHALICNHFNFDKVIYISIIPNSKGSAGITVYRPNEEFVESGIYTKEYLLSRICVLLAGRAGEQLIYGDNKITTGASNDIFEARKLVSQIINEFAMTNEMSPSNSENKMKEILDFLYDKTKKILSSKKCLLNSIFKALMEKKELYEVEFDSIIDSHTIDVETVIDIISDIDITI